MLEDDKMTNAELLEKLKALQLYLILRELPHRELQEDHFQSHFNELLIKLLQTQPGSYIQQSS